jgi:hypothetical protein
MHGKGIYRFTNGNVYEGDFLNDKMHGKGIYRIKDGAVYDGDWLTGMKHGKGKYIFANGDVYEGDFLDDKMTNGSFSFANLDHKFSASFTGGDDSAYGYRLYHLVLSHEDGSVYKEGKFSNGTFKPNN